MGFNQPKIKQEIKKFSHFLTVLCDEEIDISDRYNRAFNGDLKIKGVSDALISKVLTIHNPNFYFVKNKKTKNALKKYGLELPRGLSEGEKYKIMCKFLKEICTESGIENFAVLDEYLFRIGDDTRNEKHFI